MTSGSVTVSSWAETIKRVKKIKSLCKKMKLTISDVKVEQLRDVIVYNRQRKGVKNEQFKITWSYTL